HILEHFERSPLHGILSGNFVVVIIIGRYLTCNIFLKQRTSLPSIEKRLDHLIGMVPANQSCAPENSFGALMRCPQSPNLVITLLLMSAEGSLTYRLLHWASHQMESAPPPAQIQR